MNHSACVLFPHSIIDLVFGKNLDGALGKMITLKIHWSQLKICCSRTTGPIYTKLGTKHPFV